MSNWQKLLAIKLLLLSTSIFSGTAFADNKNYVDEGIKCTKITDRVQRLLCFDETFKSPIRQVNINISPPDLKKPDGPLRLMANALERQRDRDDDNWIIRARPWQQTMLLTLADFDRILVSGVNKQPDSENAIQHEWTPQTVDIFMTMREADVPAERPGADEATMMLSCENDITTLAILLPKPIQTLQANLSMSSGSGSIFKLNWRDVENGTVVIAGRGLESIDSIKTIANYSRVQVQVNYPEGPRAFVFDINNLKDRLKPLRTACHW